MRTSPPGAAPSAAPTAERREPSEIGISAEADGYRLRARQYLELPRARVWEFFADPRNLARITPPWLRFRCLDPDRGSIAAGARLEYRIRWAGLSLPWTSEITAYDPPRLFEDTQIRGPYAGWAHRHEFEQADSGTRVTDEVLYRLPFGILGRAAHGVLVARQLRGIFRYRAGAVRRELGLPP